MKLVGLLSFICFGLCFVGCGSSSSNNNSAAPVTQTAIPQQCYSNAAFRTQNALGVCASVPNVDQRCYTDSNFRVNNLSNGVCSGTTSINNNTSTYCTMGNCNGTNNNVGISFPVQNGNATCGQCATGEQVVVSPFSNQVSCESSSSLVGGAIYFGGSFGKINGQRFETFEFSITGGGMFSNSTRNSVPTNTCQGDNAAVACRVNTNDCATIFAANNATCIPQPNRNYGFCGIVNANGTITGL